MTPGENALSRIKSRLRRRKIDGFIIADRADVRYLSGFSGSSGFLFLSGGGDYLLTDFRYREQAKKQSPGFILDASCKNPVEKLKDIMLGGRVKTAAFEAECLTYRFYRKLASGLAPARLEPVDGWVRKLRAVKTPGEIRKIKASCRAADRAMAHLKVFIRPGAREIELEAELLYYVKKTEGADLSFPPIIISGERTSLPHGRPSGKKIAPGDFVLVDFGVRLDGYCSDLTRTFCAGRMTEEKKRLYKTVLSTQTSAIERLVPGQTAGAVFARSRRELRRAGYDLRHGLGHGVGLRVHEEPSVSASSGTKLKENMVFTVEPGDYLAGRFGVRIEDIVLMKPGGVEVLTGSPKRRNNI